MLPLSLENENNCLETVDCRNHDNRDQRKLSFMVCHSVNEIADIDTSRGKNDSSEKIDKDDKSHTETAKATHILERHEFYQIVDSGIDPSTSLR